MYTMLQLIVKRSEAHGSEVVVNGHDNTLGLGNIVVEGIVKTWTLQLVVQIEVGDAQLQHGAVA